MPLEMDRALAWFTRRIGGMRGSRLLFRPLRSHYLKRYQESGRDPWVVIGDYDGSIKMALDRSSHIGSLIYWKGRYSTGNILLLNRLLTPDSVFMDIGANQGELTLYAAKRVTRGRVVAFEPVPSLNAQLVRNISLNDFGNVIVKDVGLSDSPGTLPLYTSGDQERDGSRTNEGLASLYPSDLRSRELEPVRILRLDDVWKDLGLDRLDLVKIDTEGAELGVLRGALETLRTYRPSLLVELNRQALEAAGASSSALVELLRDLGYRIQIIEEMGRITDLDPSAIPEFCDVLATPGTP